eukprot:4213626-Amphidinium_carterae.1
MDQPKGMSEISDKDDHSECDQIGNEERSKRQGRCSVESVRMQQQQHCQKNTHQFLSFKLAQNTVLNLSH